MDQMMTGMKLTPGLQPRADPLCRLQRSKGDSQTDRITHYLYLP